MLWKWDFQENKESEERHEKALLFAFKSRLRGVKKRSSDSEPLSVFMLKKKYSNQSGKCLYCRVFLTFSKLKYKEQLMSCCEVDRIDVTKNTYVNNFQLLCKSCNIRKGKRDKLEHCKLFLKRQKELLLEPLALIKRVCKYKKCSEILDAAEVNQFSRGNAVCSKHAKLKTEFQEESYDADKHHSRCCRLLAFWFKGCGPTLNVVDSLCHFCKSCPVYTKPVFDSIFTNEIQWICDNCAFKTCAHPEAEISVQLSAIKSEIEKLFSILKERYLETNTNKIVFMFDCEKAQRKRFENIYGVDSVDSDSVININLNIF
jgi:hypothetical protein